VIVSYAPALIVLAPLVGALLTVALALNHARRARAIVLTATLVSLAAGADALWLCSGGAVLTYPFGGWAAPYGIVYRIDTLAALMTVLIGGIGTAIFVYAGSSVTAELPGNESSFLATASLLITALQGMVVTGDLFNLYVFLEIGSIAAYTLIASGGGLASLASFRYLLVGTIGASFYLLGVGYVFAMTGTLNMTDMAVLLPALGVPAPLLLAAAFVITGFALKMPLFPMHGWLPDAYTYAPSAATSLIAALMGKVSAFALLRVVYDVFWPALAPLDLPIAPLLGWLASAGIIAGSLMALAQTDLKRLLAYSSISQLGYVALGLALANRYALIGAVLHIIGHAVTKGCLFLVAGAVSYREGVRSEPGLHRLGRKMPASMAAFVIAALSMIGVPPTIGFFSKWYLLLGAIEGGRIGFVAVLLLSTLLNVWYFFRLIETIYFAEPEHAAHEEPRLEVELPRAMLVPITAMAAAILVLGLLSGPLVRHVVSDAVDPFPRRMAPPIEQLARISHQPPAASADRSASQGRAPSGLLDILLSMPASASVRAALIYCPLRALATESGEKCGLAVHEGER
jgi:multicomponent Na+:H+ antiporter subunit D